MTEINLSFDGNALLLEGREGTSLYFAQSGLPGRLSTIPAGRYWISRDQLWIGWMRHQMPGSSKENYAYSSSFNFITLFPEVPKSHNTNCFIYGGNHSILNSINLGSLISEFIAELKSLFKGTDLQTITLDVTNSDNQSSMCEIPDGPPPQSLFLDRLIGHIPQDVLDEIAVTASTNSITSIERLAHFIGQCSAESANFIKTTEDLTYKRNNLLKNYKKFFLTHEIDDYVGHPDKIASMLYGPKRSSIGNLNDEDAIKFIGRGYIHVSGRTNYQAFANDVKDQDIMKNPELVATAYPLNSAYHHFKKYNIWQICDLGVNEAAIFAVSVKVNGKKKQANGKIEPNHLFERRQLTKKFYKLLKDDNN